MTTDWKASVPKELRATHVRSEFRRLTRLRLLRKIGEQKPGVRLEDLEITCLPDLTREVHAEYGGREVSIKLHDSELKILTGEYHANHECRNKRPIPNAVERIAESAADALYEAILLLPQTI